MGKLDLACLHNETSNGASLYTTNIYISKPILTIGYSCILNVFRSYSKNLVTGLIETTYYAIRDIKAADSELTGYHIAIVMEDLKPTRNRSPNGGSMRDFYDFYDFYF